MNVNIPPSPPTPTPTRLRNVPKVHVYKNVQKRWRGFPPAGINMHNIWYCKHVNLIKFERFAADFGTQHWPKYVYRRAVCYWVRSTVFHSTEFPAPWKFWTAERGTSLVENGWNMSRYVVQDGAKIDWQGASNVFHTIADAAGRPHITYHEFLALCRALANSYNISQCWQIWQRCTTLNTFEDCQIMTSLLFIAMQAIHGLFVVACFFHRSVALWCVFTGKDSAPLKQNCQVTWFWDSCVFLTCMLWFSCAEDVCKGSLLLNNLANWYMHSDLLAWSLGHAWSVLLPSNNSSEC